MSLPGRHLCPAERAGAAAGPLRGPEHPPGRGPPPARRRGHGGRQPPQDGLGLTGEGRGPFRFPRERDAPGASAPPSAAGPNLRPGPSAAHRRHPALYPLRTAPAATSWEPHARRRPHGEGNFPPLFTPRRRSPAHPHGGEPRWRRKSEAARCLPGYGPGRTRRGRPPAPPERAKPRRRRRGWYNGPQRRPSPRYPCPLSSPVAIRGGAAPALPCRHPPGQPRQAPERGGRHGDGRRRVPVSASAGRGRAGRGGARPRYRRPSRCGQGPAAARSGSRV